MTRSDPSGQARPYYPEPVAEPVPGSVAIIVVNWNGAYFLRRALSSIARNTTDHPYQLVIVDNGSDDDSPAVIDEFKSDHPQVDVVGLRNGENTYFSAAFNQGLVAAVSSADYVVVFCNDVEVKRPGWLRAMVSFMEESGADAIGQAYSAEVNAEQRQIFDSNRPTYRQADLEQKMWAFITTPSARYVHIAGYCFMLKRRVLADSGFYLQHGEFRQYHSDWELYIRLHVLGYRVQHYQPDVHHWHSISELIAFHPDLYDDLLRRLSDPSQLAKYLQEGRELYPAESGYAARLRETAVDS